MGETQPTNQAVASEVNNKLPLLALATWNIRGFGRPELADLAGILTVESLSLIVLQELQHSQAQRLAVLTGMEHIWSFKHSPLGPLVRYAEGLALYSTERLLRTETLVLTPRTNRFSHRRRIAQFAYFERFDTDVVNIHLASHEDSAARAEQLRLVVDRIRSRGARRCIVAGDFNATNEPTVYGQLENNGFSDIWLAQQDPVDVNQHQIDATFSSSEWLGQLDTMSTLREGSGFTNPAGRAAARLDRIFARGFTVNAAAVPVDNQRWAKRSDHLPVFAGLTPV
jgi:endonuclease/exonuclease/phosphatase family metal-dependent hydrolase